MGRKRMAPSVAPDGRTICRTAHNSPSIALAGTAFTRRELVTITHALMLLQDLLGRVETLVGLQALMPNVATYAHAAENAESGMLSEGEIMALVIRLRSITLSPAHGGL